MIVLASEVDYPLTAPWDRISSPACVQVSPVVGAKKEQLVIV